MVGSAVYLPHLPYMCRTVESEVIAMGATKPRAKARLEARIDAELDDLIVEAASRLNVSKTTFVSDAVREAALKVSRVPTSP